MKKILIIFFIIFILALVSFVNIPFGDRLPEIFFGICGVLFSVGMSQTMSFDFYKIVDTEKYNKSVKGLKKVRVSFIIQFVVASFAFIALQIIKSYPDIKWSMPLLKGQIYFNVFINLLIVYSLFFFLYNFCILANKKMELDKTYRDEAVEDLE